MTAGFHYTQDGAIAWLRLARPEARNALSPRMLCGIADAFVDYRDRPDLRALVIIGEGAQAFCAGGDLGTTLPLLTGAREPANPWEERLLRDPQVLAASSLRDFALHKPVVCAVNGACLAAGLELLLGTDIRIAAPHALFGLPEARRGLVPFAGSMVRLPRQIGHANAMRLMLTGAPVNADEALRMGLISEVVPALELEARALALAQQLAANAPLALQAIKQTAVDSSGLALAAAYRVEDATARAVLATEDAREGPRAFLERREPLFTGR